MPRRTIPPAEFLGIERPISVRIRSGDIWTLTLDDKEGRGFVSLSGFDFSATYWWPRWARGTPSLLDFLIGCDSSYIAIKFRCGNDFDAERTERAIKTRLYQGWRSRYAELRDTVSFSSQSEWEHWIWHTAPRDKGEPWEVFEAYTHIRPSFARFYADAWPLLRAQRKDIEAALYPNGVPTEERKAG